MTIAPSATRIGDVIVRIHITGASGSGTTTLGRAVALSSGARHRDTDDYYWLPTTPPYREKRPIQDRLRLLNADLAAHASWVLSGSLAGWGDPLIPLFELVVLVATPTPVRLARLSQREIERYGADAIQPGGAMHAQHLEFLAWAARYDEGDESIRSRRRHEVWLTSLSCPVLRVDGTRSIADLVGEVLARRSYDR